VGRPSSIGPFTNRPNASAGDRDPALVGVAIVSWNVRPLLLRALASVTASSVPTRVVVVDNASVDGSAEAVRAAFPGVVVVANADNPGFAVGNNQALRALGVLGGDVDAGVRHADSRPPAPAALPPPYVLLLNPDAELRPGALEALVAYLEAHPGVGALGPLLRYPDGSVQSSRRRFPGLAALLTEATPIEWRWPDHPIARRMRMDDVPPDHPQAVAWLNGAAVLLRIEALAAVGGFDEGFFMYSEELDLCRRLRGAGWAIHFVPGAEVIHHEGRSSEQVVAARHARFVRSRVRYVAKHHGRAAATLVDAAIRAQFAVELALEAAKWALGHRRALRAERVRAYWGVVRGRRAELAGSDDGASSAGQRREQVP